MSERNSKGGDGGEVWSGKGRGGDEGEEREGEEGRGRGRDGGEGKKILIIY